MLNEGRISSSDPVVMSNTNPAGALSVEYAAARSRAIHYVINFIQREFATPGLLARDALRELRKLAMFAEGAAYAVAPNAEVFPVPLDSELSSKIDWMVGMMLLNGIEPGAFAKMAEKGAEAARRAGVESEAMAIAMNRAALAAATNTQRHVADE